MRFLIHLYFKGIQLLQRQMKILENVALVGEIASIVITLIKAFSPKHLAEAKLLRAKAEKIKASTKK